MIAGLKPKDEESLKQFQHLVGGAVHTLIGRDLPNSSDVEKKKLEEEGKLKEIEVS